MKSLASTILFLLAMTLIGPGSVALGEPLTTIDFPGAVHTLALDINESGDIVGRYIDNDKKTHAFLLSKGVFTTIDFPGAILTTANGINSRGDIVDRYVSSDSTGHVAVLSGDVFEESQSLCRGRRTVVKADGPSFTPARADNPSHEKCDRGKRHAEGHGGGARV